MGNADAEPASYVSFDTSLSSLHTYLGEIDDTYRRMSFLDGGEILTLPMIELEGVVLFPEATLPLRVTEPRMIAAVERSMAQTNTGYTVAVVRILNRSASRGFHLGRPPFAMIGTTAEICKCRRFDDGTLNAVARGQQRFRLLRSWVDADFVPCAEVQIINEDEPLRTPRAAFAQLASHPNPSHRHIIPNKQPDEDEENEWEEHVSDLGMRPRQPLLDSPGECGVSGSSSDDDIQRDKHGWICASASSVSHVKEGYRAVNKRKGSYLAPLTFWPRWVYQMYDSFSLARKAADMWDQVIGAPTMDSMARKPGLLSFHIASRLPLSESTRVGLLEMNGISYRLQKEIQLLERFDRVRCKSCETLIGRRSDMAVMSADGPLNAYANPGGYVHEIMTLTRTKGLVLLGSAVKEHSWFPGYAWTITRCATCESYMGWLFTATRPRLQPRSFWGIRSSQVLDDAELSQD